MLLGQFLVNKYIKKQNPLQKTSKKHGLLATFLGPKKTNSSLKGIFHPSRTSFGHKRRNPALIYMALSVNAIIFACKI